MKLKLVICCCSDFMAAYVICHKMWLIMSVLHGGLLTYCSVLYSLKFGVSSPRTNRLDFDGDPDHDPDLGFLNPDEYPYLRSKGQVSRSA